MKYKINEIFMSMQGEGFNQGKKVLFIRLSGCNLKCKWCDTNHHTFSEMSIDEIFTVLSNYNCKSIIITGGEPTIYDLIPLLTFLKNKNYWIGIESNASINIENLRSHIDYIAVSPKKDINQFIVNEVRIVNDNISIDYLLNIEKIITAENYFLSPLDNGTEMNIKETLELLGDINEFGNKKWSISLQLHKLAGIE